MIGISAKLRPLNHESRLGRFGLYIGLVSEAVPALHAVSDDGVGMCDWGHRRGAPYWR